MMLATPATLVPFLHYAFNNIGKTPYANAKNQPPDLTAGEFNRGE